MFARCVFHFPRPVEPTVCGGGPFVGISTESRKREGGRKRRNKEEKMGISRGGCFQVRCALLVFSFIMIYTSREQRCGDTRR